MIKYIADEAHFKEVITRVPNVRKTLWIGTADIKDLYVGERPFLGVLADLVAKGRAVRLIHAKEPGPNFREDFKILIFDLKVAYIGSANLTGAGIGLKGAGSRNFEAGVLTDEPELVEAAINQFDSVWRGAKCKTCRRKKSCGDPIV